MGVTPVKGRRTCSRFYSQALNGQQGDVIVLGRRADVAEKRLLDLFDEFGYCGGGGPDAIAG